MRVTVALAQVCTWALLVAGCATGGVGAQATPASTPSSSVSSAGGLVTIREFKLLVKCPGIHEERTHLGWSDDKIMEHEQVTADQIEQCEAWSAAQPRGYVPPPPMGDIPKSNR